MSYQTKERKESQRDDSFYLLITAYGKLLYPDPTWSYKDLSSDAAMKEEDAVHMMCVVKGPITNQVINGRSKKCQGQAIDAALKDLLHEEY